MSDSELKRKVEDLKEGNEVLALAIQRTRLSVKRLKLEYSVLLERLESRVELDPELRYENPLPTLESFKDELMTKPLKKPKSKRRKAKDRDPNMPKRPTNAYLLFCEMNKEKMRENGSQDVSRDLTEAWKSLNENDRKPYYGLYNQDRLRYQREMELYAMKVDRNNDDEEEVDESLVARERKPHNEDEEEEDEEDEEEEDEEETEPKPESQMTQHGDDEEEEDDDEDDIADVPTSEV
ncbi:Nhp10p TDEL_0D04120 [Torulaspora delbrueckii]|uniref:HMG box domain-containing protein n=1 Tax=Torulaspora delbrueckii TaxID=4950 RepID=G8ZTQ2_TORDE|nr:hypothetical protein TDEL_0D04120 [Torulaspora delbrueckii]CCE91996.1 hypothetical protein TDEL_0D04120 [Torulaspora delbrueckii]